MSIKNSCCWLLLIIISSPSFSQKIKKADQPILDNLHAHIQFLADDKLEGRRTGTPGEIAAMNYIAEQFRQIGLQPRGTDNYFQAFDINEGKQINSSTHFSINKNEL